MKKQLVCVPLLLALCGTTAQSQQPTLRAGLSLEFGSNGAKVVDVEPNGPGTNLFNEAQSGARLERGDLIGAVDGRPVRSEEDWKDIVERSGDGVLSLSIRDVNSGNIVVWSLQARPTATSTFDIAFDAFRRGIRGDSIPYTPFVFDEKENYVMSNLNSVLTPVYGSDDSATPQTKFERLMTGVAAIDVFSKDNPERTPISEDVLTRCRELLAEAEPRIRELPTEDKVRIQAEVSNQCYELLLNEIDRWARNKQLRHVQEATLPRQIAFRAISSVPGATVQLLLTSEKVLRLKTQGYPVRPVDPNGMQYLAQSVTWRPLPQPPEEATAYGKYYYRFVYSEAGNTVVTPFNEQQIITINAAPQTGEIYFQKY
jgi:hypothetical protein